MNKRVGHASIETFYRHYVLDEIPVDATEGSMNRKATMDAADTRCLGEGGNLMPIIHDGEVYLMACEADIYVMRHADTRRRWVKEGYLKAYLLPEVNATRRYYRVTDLDPFRWHQLHLTLDEEIEALRQQVREHSPQQEKQQDALPVPQSVPPLGGVDYRGLPPGVWAEIEGRFARGEASQNELAREYGITPSAISVHRKRKGLRR